MMHYILAMILFTNIIHTSMIQYPEDAYLMPAPQELVDSAQRVAQLMGFEDQCYIIVPKKPALEINPWNKFIAHGLHPENKIPLIIINPEWFSSLREDQQTFLLGRCFVGFQQGITPPSVTVFPLLWMMFIIFLATCMILGINNTRLGKQKLWIRLLMVYIILLIGNLTFLNRIQKGISNYLLRRHDHYIHTCVIEKTGNKKAAINAFLHYDQSMQEEATKGDPFWEPFEHLFADYAQKIKDMQ